MASSEVGWQNNNRQEYVYIAVVRYGVEMRGRNWNGAAVRYNWVAGGNEKVSRGRYAVSSWQKFIIKFGGIVWGTAPIAVRRRPETQQQRARNVQIWHGHKPNTQQACRMHACHKYARTE